MAAKKAAASKKAAPKKAAPEFPLPHGHYFHPPVVSPRGHAGTTEAERRSIRLIQKAVGVVETGYFDDTTADAVSAWNERNGNGSTPVVDADRWKALVN